MATKHIKWQRILRGWCQTLWCLFLFLSLQGGSPVGSEPGGRISPKSTKPNPPKNIYEGINNLESPQSNKPGLSCSSISHSSVHEKHWQLLNHSVYIWYQNIRQMHCMNCAAGLMDRYVWSTLLPLVTSLPALFPLSQLCVFHADSPLSVVPYYLWQLFRSVISPNLLISLPICQRLSLHITAVAQGHTKCWSKMRVSLHIHSAQHNGKSWCNSSCLRCSSQSPSKIGKLAATRIGLLAVKTRTSFQLLTISLSASFSPLGHKDFTYKKKWRLLVLREKTGRSQVKSSTTWTTMDRSQKPQI